MNPDLQPLRDKIMSYGASEEEVDQIMQDMLDLVTRRAMNEYMEKISDPKVKEFFQTATPEEAKKYIEEHEAELPELTVERFQQISEETWAQYFRFMDEN